MRENGPERFLQLFSGLRFGGPALINFDSNKADARYSFVSVISSDQWDYGSKIRLGCAQGDIAGHVYRVVF